MQQSTYSYFLNQVISLKPAVRNTKAVGTDGELALCNALKDNLPGAVSLRCLKHIKDSIERKLNDLKFDSQSSCVVLADIFGNVIGGVRELGLSDSIDKDDFFGKLMALEKKWNDIERKHRHFLAHQRQNPVFYDWFCTNYSKVFSESVIQSVRERAGLGKPPRPFYNNRSESINKVIKQHVQNKKNALPVFVKQLYTLIEEQTNSMKKAAKKTGDWCLKDQAHEPTRQLSYSNDSLVESSMIDKGILDSIWEKAANLAYSEGFITRIPGDFEGKGRMVASSNSKNPHMVTVGRKNDSTFHCDRHCPRYSSYKFCAHTIAVAEVNGCLIAFVKEIKKSKITANMSKLAYHGLQGGAGEKGGRPKPKRQRSSQSISDLPTKDRLGSSSVAAEAPPTTKKSRVDLNSAQSPSVQPKELTNLRRRVTTSVEDVSVRNRFSSSTSANSTNLPSPSAQPYIFKSLIASIKVCAGCRLGYINRSPPYDICVVHKETRPIKNPQTNETMILPVNAHYHATCSKSCILHKDPKFTSKQLVVPENMKQMLQSAVYKDLLQQEFNDPPN